MELTTGSVSSDQIADIVVRKLLEMGAIGKLATATMDTIETESISLMDEVTRNVMAKVLALQSSETQASQQCPKCGSRCCDKPPQGKLLETRRGKVNFQTSVFRCEACRLDFFPSVRSFGV